MGASTMGSIQDGTSNTIAFAEKRAGCVGGSNGSNGNLWGHGWWNADWMPTFANSDIYGAQAYQTPPQLIPTNANCVQWRASAFSAGGCLVGMCDGSSRSISTTINPLTWQYILQPGDGQSTGDF